MRLIYGTDNKNDTSHLVGFDDFPAGCVMKVGGVNVTVTAETGMSALQQSSYGHYYDGHKLHVRLQALSLRHSFKLGVPLGVSTYHIDCNH